MFGFQTFKSDLHRLEEVTSTKITDQLRLQKVKWF